MESQLRIRVPGRMSEVRGRFTKEIANIGRNSEISYAVSHDAEEIQPPIFYRQPTQALPIWCDVFTPP